MGKEYDLMNELGRGNWIDAVAGEAVVLGSLLRDPELEAKGGELAALVAKYKYDDDEFFKVEAFAKGLEVALLKAKSERERSVFIDKIVSDDKPCWPNRVWEYELLFVEGRYQIWMNLLDYFDKGALANTEKAMAEQLVRQLFPDSSFEGYQKTYTETTSEQGQKYRVTKWLDNSHKLLREIINHDHADNLGKGWLEKFFFDDFGTAASAWKKIKDVVAR